MTRSDDRRRLHLPDCPSLATDQDCDCGKPPHPMGTNMALVRRKRSRKDKLPRLMQIPRSKLKPGERDFNESRLG